MADEKSTGRPLDSHTLYPDMMKTTKLLVLDYDVTRYHSFDVFRFMLLEKENFMKCKKELYPMLEPGQVFWDKVLFYMEHCPNFNPFDNFEGANQLSIHELDDLMNTMLASDRVAVTRTDLDEQFRVVFDKPTVDGFLLQYENDVAPSFTDTVKRYTSKKILDLRMVMEIIQKENINAIMLSSVDLAVIIAERLLAMKDDRNISFIIANYWYNYDPETKLMRHIQEMNILEYYRKHEFGIFDPFSSLHYKRKIEQENS